MSTIDELLLRNRQWSDDIRRREPEFFRELSRQQAPKYMWIGCSDSRVPANQIVGMQPGEVFVHRNVANVVVHADLNCLSVLQFAIDVLKVEHIIVCGHYGCGGVHAALEGHRHGLVDNWLRHVGDVANKHQSLLDLVDTPSLRHGRLCELNVIEQALNVSQTTVVEDAWERGQPVSVHGFIYSLFDGRITDLGFAASSRAQVLPSYANALGAVRERVANQPEEPLQ